MTRSPDSALQLPACPAPGPSRAGLLGKLMAAVRPEFRVDIYLPATDDPVLGVRECSVPGCDRAFWLLGLCSAHARRWRLRGQPDMADFLADPGPALHGRSEPGGCLVNGCQYGTAGHGICSRHRRRWEHAGRPGPAAWAATVDAVPPEIAEAMPQCRLPFLQPLDGERPQYLLQVAHHSLASAQLPAAGGVHPGRPTARQSTHRFPAPALPCAAGVAVRRAVPPPRTGQTPLRRW